MKILPILIVVAVAVAVVAADRRRSVSRRTSTRTCPRYCPKYYRPICAFDGLQFKMFDNQCLLQTFNYCGNHPRRLFRGGYHLSHCKTGGTSGSDECGKTCPKNYKPICATNEQDFKIFANACFLYRYNRCSVAPNERKYEQTDFELCKEKCASGCSRERNPQCGYNGAVYREFGNPCLMRAYNNCEVKNGKVFGLVDLALCRTKPECPRVCTKEYNPVCGYNGEVYKEFGNKCMFNAYNACDVKDNKKFEEVELNLCKPKCPRPCTREYNPVCGFNGLVYKQFGNPCNLRVYNECEVKDGKMFEKVELSLCKPKCPRACTLEYNPVCGFNGVIYKVFGNECAMTAYNECNPKNGDKFVETDLELCQQTEECPKFCTREYNPVCGYNGKLYKEFGNNCMLNAYNLCDVKDGKKYEEVELNLCKPKPKCPRQCTEEYNPVCGFNGLEYKQFGNPCQLQDHNECLVKDGKLFEKVELSLCKPDCPRFCTLQYDPVCGFNGKVYREFGNGCQLSAYNLCEAKDGEEFTTVSLSLCQSKPDCPRACTADFNPVCGFNGNRYRAFGNKCSLTAYNECDAKEGEQFEQVDLDLCEPKCPRACTLEFNPVCGFNGVVYKKFGNACGMSAYNDCEVKDGPKFDLVDLEQCDCPQRCPQTLIYAPVCGYNGKKYRIFDSDCTMNNANCQNPDESAFAKVDFTLCNDIKCPRNCDKKLDPVCAFDGKMYRQFDNQCLLQQFNDCDRNVFQYFYAVINKKQCVVKSECPTICPAIYAPVCGRNAQGEYKSFSSECNRSAFNCINPENQYTGKYDLSFCNIEFP